MLSLQQVTLESARYRWYGARRWSPLLQNVSLISRPAKWWHWLAAAGRAKVCCCNACSICCRKIYAFGEITLDGNRLDRHTIRQLRGNTFSYVPQGYRRLIPC